MLTLIGPGTHTIAFDGFAQSQHFIPGFGIGPALLFKEGFAVPDAKDGHGDVQFMLNPAPIAQDLRAGEEGLPKGFAGGIQRWRVHQRGQVQHLTFVNQGGSVQTTGAAVVNHIGWVAANEAGAQVFSHALNALDRHFVVGMQFEEEVCGVVNVVASQAAFKEDSLNRCASFQIQRVYGIRRYFKGQVQFWRSGGGGSGCGGGGSYFFCSRSFSCCGRAASRKRGAGAKYC